MTAVPKAGIIQAKPRATRVTSGRGRRLGNRRAFNSGSGLRGVQEAS